MSGLFGYANTFAIFLLIGIMIQITKEKAKPIEYITLPFEIIGCVERGISEINTMDELLQILYTDRYTTSENIAEISKYSCKCRDVISSISNLYLRKQIIFERL